MKFSCFFHVFSMFFHVLIKNSLARGFFMSVVTKKISASLYSIFMLLICLVAAFSSGCGSKASLDPAKPVTLTIWHVYGNQTNSPMIQLKNLMPVKAKPRVLSLRLPPLTALTLSTRLYLHPPSRSPALYRCPTCLRHIRALFPQCTISCCIGTNILIKKI